MDYFTIEETSKYFASLSKVKSDFRRLVETQNFSYYEPSFFESYDHFIPVQGLLAKAQNVQLQGRNGKVLLLRPDITTSIMKEVIPKIKNGNTVKLYYDTVKFSRHFDGYIEEDKQFGVEALSEKESLEEDVLLLALELFTSLNRDFVIEVGSTRFFKQLVNYLALDKDEEKTLKALLYRKDASKLNLFINSREFLSDAKWLLKNIFSLQGTLEEVVSILEKFNDSSVFLETLTMLKSLDKIFNQHKLSEALQIDLTLQSRYDYYDGLVFKGYLMNSPEAVMRGGRYDSLTETFGVRKKAVGFSIALDACVKEVMNRG